MCQALRLQNVAEAYQPKQQQGCPDWRATCLPQRESCEVGCSSSEGAYEEEVLGKWTQAAITENYPPLQEPMLHVYSSLRSVQLPVIQ